MNWYQIEVNENDSVQFKGNFPNIRSQREICNEETDENFGVIGGIIKNGELSWLACERTILIISLRSQQTLSRFEFSASKGYAGYTIQNVEEVLVGKTMLLAVLLEENNEENAKNISTNSLLVMYSVELSKPLSCIELDFNATCLKFLNSEICQRSYLQNFEGVLAIGSNEGYIVLLNIESKKIHILSEKESSNNKFHQCKVFDSNLTLPSMRNNYIQCQKDNVYFAIKLESAENRVNCILPIDLILGLAVGHENGVISFYDLIELQIFTTAEPPTWLRGAAIKKLNYIVPPDDPRPFLYVWSMYEKTESVCAVMYSIIFEKRVQQDDNAYYFENFVNCLKSLELPLESAPSTVIDCQAIFKMSTHAENYMICLCAFSWYSWLEKRTKLIVFDLNQWYKEQMPALLDVNGNVSFLACYVLNDHACCLSTYLNSNTVAPFNSMQRIEEHFYPNSLSFDIRTLSSTDANAYNWVGVQNRVINMLRVADSTLFLRYRLYFDLIIEARLLPQFNDLRHNSIFSRKLMYEIILSVALEHNCMNLLNNCVECWADGSFMGQNTSGGVTDLGLSTLTDWIWKRACEIKARCNELGNGIFEYGGYPLDQREQQEFGYITRQMRLLSELLNKILTKEKHKISEKIYENLNSKYKSICDAVGYQEVLSWLSNVGLLPEGSYYNADASSNNEIVQYPCVELKSIYSNRRASFAKLSNDFISKKTGYCRLLYIDSLIEHAFPGNALREYWTVSDDDDGLYPPTSFGKLLNVLLVPNVDFNHKCIVLLYFFLDVHMMLDAESHKNIIQSFIKFPGVFKLSAALIKMVQSFWSLDHKQFLPAVEEFTSPINNIQSCPQWTIELLIESLIIQDEESLALRVLESVCSVGPTLRMKTLVANNLISEAFQFVRSSLDKDLLQLYFKCCLATGNFNAVCALALTNRESNIFQEILKQHKNNDGTENLHLIFLLQRSKYLEALSYMDDITKSQKSFTNTNTNTFSHRIDTIRTQIKSSSSTMTTPSTTPIPEPMRRMRNIENLDTSNMVISAYNSTMTPVSRGLTDVYFRIKHKMKQDIDVSSPVPFSCQLIKQNANDLPGGIYQSSALSTLLATSNYNELMPDAENQTRLPASESIMSFFNAPFLHKMQILPDGSDFDIFRKRHHKPIKTKPYKMREKRRFVESDLYESETIDDATTKSNNELENPRKRRRFIEEQQQESDQFKSSNHFIRNDLIDKKEFIDNDLRAPIGRIRQLGTPSVDVASEYSEESINRISPLKSPTSSILKTNISDTESVRTTDKKKVSTEDVKNLRFILPPTNDAIKPTSSSSSSSTSSSTSSSSSSSLSGKTNEDTNMNDLTVVEQKHTFQEPHAFYRIPTDLCTDFKLSDKLVVFRPPEIIEEVVDEVEEDETKSEINEEEAHKEHDNDVNDENLSITQKRTATPFARQNRQVIIETDINQDMKNSSMEIEENEAIMQNIITEEPTSMDIDEFEEQFYSPLSSPTYFSGPKARKSLSKTNDIVKTTEDSKIITSMSSTTTIDTTSSVYHTCLSQFQSDVASTSNLSPQAHSNMAVASIFSSKEFKPKIFSSKVCETESKLFNVNEKIKSKIISEIKISDQSTVEGTILSELLESDDHFGSIESSHQKSSETAANSHKNFSEKKQMLDTTLGMSSFDLTSFMSKQKTSVEVEGQIVEHADEKTNSSDNSGDGASTAHSATSSHDSNVDKKIHYDDDSGSILFAFKETPPQTEQFSIEKDIVVNEEVSTTTALNETIEISSSSSENSETSDTDTDIEQREDNVKINESVIHVENEENLIIQFEVNDDDDDDDVVDVVDIVDVVDDDDDDDDDDGNVVEDDHNKVNAESDDRINLEMQLNKVTEDSQSSTTTNQTDSNSNINEANINVIDVNTSSTEENPKSSIQCISTDLSHEDDKQLHASSISTHSYNPSETNLAYMHNEEDTSIRHTIDSGVMSANTSDLANTISTQFIIQQNKSPNESEKTKVIKPIKKHILNELEMKADEKKQEIEKSTSTFEIGSQHNIDELVLKTTKDENKRLAIELDDRYTPTKRLTRRASLMMSQEKLTHSIEITPPAQRLKRAASVSAFNTNEQQLTTTPTSATRAKRAASVSAFNTNEQQLTTTPTSATRAKRAASLQPKQLTDGTPRSSSRKQIVDSPANIAINENLTPRRSKRATSLQPTTGNTSVSSPSLKKLKKVVSEDLNVSSPRLRARRKSMSSSNLLQFDESEMNDESNESISNEPTIKRRLRGTSQPPSVGNITNRQASALLEELIENDSPSLRTRSRTRLSSVDSTATVEDDTSASTKTRRTRRQSVSEKETTKRSKENVGAKKSLDAIQEDQEDDDKPTAAKRRIGRSRK